MGPTFQKEVNQNKGRVFRYQRSNDEAQSEVLEKTAGSKEG